MHGKRLLTGLQVQLLKKSYRQLEPLSVALLFYKKLFGQYPQLIPLFPVDNSELTIKLMSVLELVVFSFEEKDNDQFFLQESMIIPLRDLGLKHEDHGVKPEHYEIANDLLIDSIHEQLVDHFSDDVKKSWIVALEMLTDAMLDTSIDKHITKSSGLLFPGVFRQLIYELKNKMSLSQ